MCNINLSSSTLRQFIILQFLILFSFPVLAYDFTYNGEYYNIISEENCEVEITKVNTLGSTVIIDIPSTVEYNGKIYTVTAIADKAFYDCSNLSRVGIPNSITRIGEFAFRNCSSLRSVNIPNSVTSIGRSAFVLCSGLERAEFANIESICNIYFETSYSNPLYYAHNPYINGEKITDLIIPNSVTSIGKYAFYGCSGLTSITIPNSVTSIGMYAFSRCSRLTSINIPNSVTSIGWYAFQGCRGLTSITIPNSITGIECYAFSGCSGLTSITIPNSVYYINSNAFYNCSHLTSITIPNSVYYIGYNAFAGCNLTSVVIPHSVTYIMDEAFSDCSNLTLLIIGGSETEFDRSPFRNTGIEMVVLPEKYASKDESWFEMFGKNVSFYFYNNSEELDLVDDCVFSRNHEILYCGLGLLSGDYIVPETVKTIESGAFKACNKLKSVLIPNTVTEVCDDIFGGQSGVKKCAKPSTLKVPTGDNVVAINYDVYDSRIEVGFVYTRNKRAVYFAPTQLPDDYVLH